MFYACLPCFALLCLLTCFKAWESLFGQSGLHPHHFCAFGPWWWAQPLLFANLSDALRGGAWAAVAAGPKVLVEEMTKIHHRFYLSREEVVFNEVVFVEERGLAKVHGSLLS